MISRSFLASQPLTMTRQGHRQVHIELELLFNLLVYLKQVVWSTVEKLSQIVL